MNVAFSCQLPYPILHPMKKILLFPHESLNEIYLGWTRKEVGERFGVPHSSTKMTDFYHHSESISVHFDSNDLVVYIGKGVIESRVNAPQRAKWVYDVIEYSIISDPEKQFEWENFWIERYKEEHRGEKPLYNQINGRNH